MAISTDQSLGISKDRRRIFPRKWIRDRCLYRPRDVIYPYEGWLECVLRLRVNRLCAVTWRTLT